MIEAEAAKAEDLEEPEADVKEQNPARRPSLESGT